MVVAVPRERPPIGWKPRDRCFAEGRRFFRWRARQSEGTTSKPEPGRSRIPAFFASASRAASDSNTTASPVTSR